MPDAAHGLVLPHLDRARTRPGDASAAAVETHRRRKRSVGFWLALLVGASMAPVAIVAAILLYHDYQHQRARVVQDSIVTARALASTVDRELAASRTALVALASSPYLASGDLARFHAQAREVQRGIGVGGIVLHDTSGQQRLDTTQAYGTPPAPERNAAFRDVVRTGKPIVTDLFYGAGAERPAVAVAVPVFRDRGVEYVLSAGIWSDQLADVLTRQRLPEGWIATILDSTGTIVARTRDLERFRGRKATPDLVQRMAEVPEDSVDRLSLEGIPVHSSFSRSSESRWTVVLGVPRAQLVGELETTLLRLALAVALLLVASLGLASFIGRRVTHDIGALLAPAHALGRGEPVQVRRLGLQEPDDVGRALAQTSALLQSALYSAHHDPLTGLANRAFFEASVHQAILLARRTGGVLALLFVDLDGFKDVDDSLGHAAGDALLRLAAARITATVRVSDVAARLGGDEFAVLLSNTSEEGAHAVAAGLVTALSLPYDVGTRAGRVSASVGVALYPACATTADALLDSADAAMYAAKAAGRNGWVAAPVASV